MYSAPKLCIKSGPSLNERRRIRRKSKEDSALREKDTSRCLTTEH